jgi:NhaA family Na+:H+ antiporter
MSSVASPRSGRLAAPIDADRDHVLGASDAHFTLVEYGSYACEHCQAAHEVVTNLRDCFGDRLRYVFRHLPLTERAARGGWGLTIATDTRSRSL